MALCALGLALPATGASAAGPPVIGSAWSFSVLSDSGRLGAEINPNGLSTSYHFDYLTEAAYQANLAAAKEGFTGALKAPSVTDANIGSGAATISVTPQLLFNLSPDTTYRYRVVAKNSASAPSYVLGAPHSFTSQPQQATPLPDSRGWEMVSPIDKNGGQVDPPGAIAKGGVLQAAAAGGAISYGSTASFAAGVGAPPASQYIARRGSGGWSSENITAPIFSGTYDAHDQGVPYQLFSPDLARGLLLNGEHCRGEGISGCGVANPPLPGSGAPAAYQDYYLRDSASGAFAALLTNADIGPLHLDPAHFDLRFAGAPSDLGHVVLESCAALTSNATEVSLGEGCDPAQANLYEWSPGAGLSLINVFPAQSQGTPGAALAAQSGAVTTDGSRIYWTDTATGDLYLRKAGTTTALVEAGAEFQTASADGSVAFYTKADEHLYRYEAAGAGSSTDLTPAGGVLGVLGVSADGSDLYYLTNLGLFVRHGATTTKVADSADEGNYPPTTGTARVSADGTRLLFLSSASLTGYDNTDLNTGNPDSEVFLYDASGAGSLACVSCNPTGERPLGPSTIPGAIANGSAAGSTQVYKPRVLSADGRRVFFDSGDALALTDTNSDTRDVYQWEAQGEGSCSRVKGCVALISSGRSPLDALFIDASADGQDAFFLTDASLVKADPGSLDLYDARIGGGFSEPGTPIPCEGDACQALPSEPVDPTLTTLLSGHGNPPVRFHNLNRHKKPKHHKPKHKGKGTQHKRNGHKHRQGRGR